jgi:hypothetical protein
MQVGAGLRLENIVIDSIDSVLYSGQALGLNTACLAERTPCCFVDELGAVGSYDGSTKCEDSLVEYQLSGEAQCLFNYPRAMFSMQLNAEQEVTGPNEIVLQNVHIRNMMYAVNSIVQLTPI